MVSFLVRKASTWVCSFWAVAISFCSWSDTCWCWDPSSSSWPCRASLRASASRARSSFPWVRAALACSWSLSACCCNWVACSSMRFFAVVTSATLRRTFWRLSSCFWYERSSDSRGSSALSSSLLVLAWRIPDMRFNTPIVVGPSSCFAVKLRASLPDSVIGVPDPLCLLTVHAHPDDEASKGAGTVARYHAEGIRTVLVCCTGGEEGEILNPALDTPEVRGRIAEVRKEELARAAEIIGYDEVVMLGYRDSGMAGSEANANPDSFAQAPLEQAVERLVAIVRRTRPQVMVVYGDEQTSYPHPDHLRVHDIGVAAFRAAGDPDRYPGAGEAWQPFHEEWRRRWEGVPEDVASASVDISAVADVRRQALLAHATQVDPNSRFWFGLPPEVMRTVHPHDDYRLALVKAADGSVVVPEPDGEVETDLFAAIPGVVRVG